MPTLFLLDQDLKRWTSRNPSPGMTYAGLLHDSTGTRIFHYCLLRSRSIGSLILVLSIIAFIPIQFSLVDYFLCLIVLLVYACM